MQNPFTSSGDAFPIVSPGNAEIFTQYSCIRLGTSSCNDLHFFKGESLANAVALASSLQELHERRLQYPRFVHTSFAHKPALSRLAIRALCKDQRPHICFSAHMLSAWRICIPSFMSMGTSSRIESTNEAHELHESIVSLFGLSLANLGWVNT